MDFHRYWKGCNSMRKRCKSYSSFGNLDDLLVHRSTCQYTPSLRSLVPMAVTMAMAGEG